MKISNSPPIQKNMDELSNQPIKPELTEGQSKVNKTALIILSILAGAGCGGLIGALIGAALGGAFGTGLALSASSSISAATACDFIGLATLFGTVSFAGGGVITGGILGGVVKNSELNKKPFESIKPSINIIGNGAQAVETAFLMGATM